VYGGTVFVKSFSRETGFAGFGKSYMTRRYIAALWGCENIEIIKNNRRAENARRF